MRIDPPCPPDSLMIGKSERVMAGLGVSPGLALGKAHVSDLVPLSITQYRIAPEEIETELARFQAAVGASRHQLTKLKNKSATLHGSAATEVSYLLDAHLSMLAQSRLVRGVIERIRDERTNAEAAVEAEIATLSDSFAAMDDEYLAARIEDIRVVGGRLIRNLTQSPFTAISKLPPGTILLADELNPADIALMDPTQILGFATALGGADSHTAIMARALSIPAVLGCAGLVQGVCPGDPILINGFTGTVTVNPSAETLAHYTQQQSSLDFQRRQLTLLRRLPTITKDGVNVDLQVNIELPRELAQTVDVGASGIGLVRTEFLFMNRDEPPSEDEQYAMLVGLITGMQGRPVTVRTLDIGGDKLAYALREFGGDSANPALGLRAIRLGLKHRALLEVQLSAILRASLLGPVRILLPMISSIAEVQQTRQILNEVALTLRRNGVALPEKLPPLGIMIEVPGAALAADAFAAAVDFFSIGTNDLTQYTLAIDRGDEQVAHLYNPMHPAVLRLIQFATEAANRAGIPINVCGEVAGDPRYTTLLIGLGLRSLSMTPGSLPRVKQRLRQISIAHATTLARTIMALSDEQQINALLDHEGDGIG